VVLNPESGQIDFAMVLVDYPQNTTRTTPVPWFLLKYVSDQGQSGGMPGAQQVFQLNIERANMAKAPSLVKSQWSWLSNPEWRHNVYGYYGYYPTVAANTSAPPTETATPMMADATPAPVYIEGSSSASSSFGGFGTDSGFGFPFYGDGSFGSGFGVNRSTVPDNFPALFPGGDPVIPNNPRGNIFAASTNFFPGAPARLPKDNNLNVPFGTKAVPNNPGSPFSVTVPEGAQKAVSATPNSPWSVLIPAGAQQAVPNSPGQPWSVLVPADATKAQALNPGSPFSVTVPAGTTSGNGANQSPWSVVVPPSSTSGNNANSGSPFSVAMPQTSGTRVNGSAWSPIVSSTPSVSQNRQLAALNTPSFNGGFQGGAPYGNQQGFQGFHGFGGGGPPFRSGIGLAPLAPLAPLARPAPTGRHR
jgi:hypothetical protein